MTDNPAILAEQAVAYRLLADELRHRADDLASRAAAAMGRGTLYPRLPDGQEMACFVVPDAATSIAVDETRLLPWVAEHYPSELMQAVRPAFIEAIRRATKQAGTPCAPGGELDLPGVTIDRAPARGPRITARTAGKDRARLAVDSVIAPYALRAFAAPMVEGAAE